MATISRGVKVASGTTQFQTGLGTILASEVDTDLDTIVSAINGNLNNDNIVAAAAIELSKIDGFGDSSTEGRTQTSPGVSDSESLASTAQGELERLRYVESRNATGLVAQHYNGTTTATLYYGDTPARGNNLLRNGSFEAKSSTDVTVAPDGWTLVGLPGTNELVTAVVANGDGRAHHIIARASQADGTSQVIAGLKASTKYLIAGRMLITTGTCNIVTVGADVTSNFRDVTIAVTGATWQNKAIVIQTDATPTSITLSFLASNNATLDDFTLDNWRMYECSDEPTTTPGYIALWQQSTSAAGTLLNSENIFPTSGGQLTRELSVPGPGYTIKATARLTFTGGGGSGTFTGKLKESIDGGADNTVDRSSQEADNGELGSLHLAYVNTNPTVGSTYRYGTWQFADANGGTCNGNGADGLVSYSWLMVELIPPS